MPITRDWLLSQGVCGRDLEGFQQLFADEAPVDREALAAAESAGLDVLWLGLRLVDDKERGEFHAFTLTQRGSALVALLGAAMPSDVGALRKAAAEAWAMWARTGDMRARGTATALREVSRDMTVQQITPEAAQEAAHAAQRAASYAGLDAEAVKREQIEWLAARVIDGGA